MASKVKLPLQEQILNVIEVAETTVEGAEYSLERYKEIVAAAKMTDKVTDMTASFERSVDLTRMKLSENNDKWDGKQAPVSDFQNMHQGMAKKAADELVAQGISKNVHVDILIKDTSEWRRGYSEDNEDMDKNKEKHMNTICNSYLAKNNVISQKSILYDVNPDGKIAENKQGKIKADPDKVNELINDSQKGLGKFAEDLGLPKVEVQSLVIPSVIPSAKAPAPAQPAMETTIASKPAAEAPAAETPESPERQSPGAGA